MFNHMSGRRRAHLERQGFLELGAQSEQVRVRRSAGIQEGHARSMRGPRGPRGIYSALSAAQSLPRRPRPKMAQQDRTCAAKSKKCEDRIPEASWMRRCCDSAVLKQVWRFISSISRQQLRVGTARICDVSSRRAQAQQLRKEAAKLENEQA